MHLARRSPLAICLAGALAVFHSGALCSQESGVLAGTVEAEIDKAVAAYRAPARSASSVDYEAAQALHDTYDRRAHAPLWSHDGHPSAQAEALLGALQRADTYGLQPEDYAGDALTELAGKPSGSTPADAARWGRFDVRLSAAGLRFISDLHYGRVKPSSAGFNLQGPREPFDLAAALTGLASTTDFAHAIAVIEPHFHHYVILKSALTKYLGLVQHPELKDLPAVTASVKPGDAYAGAPALHRLLAALGDMPAASAPPTAEEGTFTPELSDGVRTFQQRHGMTPDGVLGKGTLTALRTPFAKRVRQIDLTLERWRWLPPFETPPIIVNIPQFRLFAFRTTEDRVADILQMDVIVGKTYPRTQTPVFESDMRYVVFRPYWDVPPSILRNEMLPKIHKNPDYLAAQRLQIVNGQGDNSPVVAPSPAAIEGLASGKYRLRQMPGEDNALGLVKFMFPNTYNVYLHSTPAHRLFNETVRTFSHGCIRVSDPLALATHVMRDEPGDWTREKIDATMNGSDSSVRVNLQHPITVLILYGTALATEAGPIQFFDDIYGLDKKLEGQLGLPPAH
jgi:murein L,D-transpeptidase YcbB/YkuD